MLYLGRAGVGDLISDRMTLLDKLTTRKVHGSGFGDWIFFSDSVHVHGLGIVQRNMNLYVNTIFFYFSENMKKRFKFFYMMTSHSIKNGGRLRRFFI